MDLDHENPLTSFEENQIGAIPTLFVSESEHMVSHNYRDESPFFRQQAVSLVLQAQYSCNFDQMIAYLAVNYLDRFLSVNDIQKNQPWVLRLLVISCISLASKMKNADLLLSDFQGEEGFIFDARTVQRMEFLVLNALKWRMRSITPFSFVYFFISFFILKDPPLTNALQNRAADIIFKSQYELEISTFKPSIIAASALLSASDELFPLQFSNFRTSISSCEYVNKEELQSCYSLMQQKVMLTDEHDDSSTKTPMSVLDLYRPLKNETNAINTVTVTVERRDVKRRKMDNLTSDW